MIKEKNGKFYVLGEKTRLVFDSKEEAEKAAGISLPVAEVEELENAEEEEIDFEAEDDE